jgi:hypothetical protein
MSHLKFDELYSRLILKRIGLKRAISSSSANAKKKNKKKKKSTSTANNCNNKRKLRILCLHGYEQNVETFRKKTGALRRAGKSHVSDFIFLGAPHDALLREGAGKDPSVDGRAWYLPSFPTTNNSAVPKFFEDDSQADDKTNASRSWSLPLDESTWNSSLEYVGKCFEEQGPFDGILGFSQGAAIASALCHLQMTKKSKKEALSSINFKFAILVSGFIPSHGLSIVNENNNDEISSSSICNTLHISGKTDNIIKPIRSKSLVEYFKENNNTAIHCEHNGGHLVPSDKHIRDAFKDFLKTQRENISA